MPIGLSYSARQGRKRRRRGQSLVEFAVVLPIFLLILCGILDFGALMYSRMTVINAARDGARFGITLTESPNQITTQVRAQVVGAGGGMVTDSMVATSCVAGPGTPAPACNAGTFANADPGDSVRVTVTYPYRPFFPLLFGHTIDISSTVQMTLE